MNIIIPMAGMGTRFKKAGIFDPKPLIRVAGKPMLFWALDSIKRITSGIKSKKYFFICLKEHEEKFDISNKLIKIAGNNCKVIFTSTVTDGAACSVLLAEDNINNEEEVLICDCDQYFICPQFMKARRLALMNNWGGLIPTAEKESNSYSYAQVDQKGNVIMTAEKKQISTHAAIGVYYFTKGNHFVWATKKMISECNKYNNEYYICPIYNEFIKKNEVVRIVPAKLWLTLGSPEEAKYFELYISKHNAK